MTLLHKGVAERTPSHQKQVSKREQREELGAVLGEAPVAGFHVAELALHDPERVLDLGPHHRDHPVDPFVEGMQLASFGRLAHHAPSLARPFEHGLAFGTDIALVGPDGGLLAMQQVVPDLTVVQSGGRGFQAVNNAAVRILHLSCLSV